LSLLKFQKLSFLEPYKVRAFIISFEISRKEDFEASVPFSVPSFSVIDSSAVSTAKTPVESPLKNANVQ